MSYISPLSLLNEEQLTSFKPENIKKLRNELLLQFQLSAEPTIILNGQPFDKDEILQLLDQLQADPDLHFSIFNNKPLLEFLEEGKPGFFISKTAQDKVFADSTRAMQIHTLIVNTINEVLPDWLLPIGYETTAFLRNINSYSKHLDTPLQDIAYSGTYEKVQQVLDTLRVNYENPFTSPGSNTFKPGLELFVTQEFIAYFKYLPKAFENLRREYCIWCNNNIVLSFTQAKEPIIRYSRETLRIVKEAAIIASAEHNREGNLRIAEQIDNFLSGGTEVAKGGNSRSGWVTVVIIIVAVIRLVAMCNRQDSRRNSNLYGFGSNYGENTYSVYNTHPKATTTYNGNDGNTKENPVVTEISPSEFNGSADFSESQHTFRGVEQKGNFTRITYEVEIIPTCLNCMKGYIPASVVNEKGRNLVLVFKKKGIPKVEFSHSLLISPGSETMTLQSTSMTNNNFKVVIKPIPIQDFRYKGYATLLNSHGNVIKRDTIEVRKKGLHQTEILYNRQLADAGNASTAEEKLRDIRVRCMLNNLEKLNQMSLFASYENSIKELWLYEFNVFKGIQSGIRDSMVLAKLKTVKDAKLNWLFTSNADQMAYFTYRGKMTDIKYFIQSETGSVEGIQMATFSRDQTVIARIELFKVH